MTATAEPDTETASSFMKNSEDDPARVRIKEEAKDRPLASPLVGDSTVSSTILYRSSLFLH